MTYDLTGLCRALQSQDERLCFRPDPFACQIYVTASTRPDVPEGVSLLPPYYQIRLRKGRLDEQDIAELLRDARSFAEKTYLN